MLAKVNEIKSQFLALQSQMNPHFLHNMLAIIAMEAQSDSESKIPSICQKLGEMLRYTSHMGNGYSTMEEEFRIAEDYLELMKIRYEDMFEYQIQMAEEIGEIHIPKLILQPICENSFQHGLKYVETPWKIFVKSWKEGNRWFWR